MPEYIEVNYAGQPSLGIVLPGGSVAVFFEGSEGKAPGLRFLEGEPAEEPGLEGPVTQIFGELASVLDVERAEAIADAGLAESVGVLEEAYASGALASVAGIGPASVAAVGEHFGFEAE